MILEKWKHFVRKSDMQSDQIKWKIFVKREIFSLCIINDLWLPFDGCYIGEDGSDGDDGTNNPKREQNQRKLQELNRNKYLWNKKYMEWKYFLYNQKNKKFSIHIYILSCEIDNIIIYI